MCVCRIAGRSASRPVCGKYRISAFCFFALPRRNAALAVKYQSKLCISRSFAVSLREGFFLLKKKRIAKLSMLYYPSEYSVSHRSVIFSMGTLCVWTWKMRVFLDQYSWSMRGRLFRKRLAAWTCRFHNVFAHTYVPIEEMTDRWEFHTWAHLNVASYPHLYAFSYIHTYFHSYIRAYAR